MDRDWQWEAFVKLWQTTSSDVHVVSWATWSSGRILGLHTFEANVVCLPTHVDRESAQDVAFQDAYVHTLSCSPFPASHSPATRANDSRVELCIVSPTATGALFINFRVLLVIAHLSNTNVTCKLERATDGIWPEKSQKSRCVQRYQAPTILVRTRSPQENIRIYLLSVLEWSLYFNGRVSKRADRCFGPWYERTESYTRSCDFSFSPRKNPSRSILMFEKKYNTEPVAKRRVADAWSPWRMTSFKSRK